MAPEEKYLCIYNDAYITTNNNICSCISRERDPCLELFSAMFATQEHAALKNKVLLIFI